MNTSQRLRVLLAATVPPPMGGIGAQTRDLLHSQLPELVDLTFVDTQHSGESSESGRFTASNAASGVRHVASFARAVRKTRPQVVQIDTAYGLSLLKHSLCVFIARAAGARVVVAPRFSLTKLISANTNRLWRAYSLFTLRRCDALIVLSREWLELGELLPGCPLYLLPNAIDLEPYVNIPLHRQGNAGPVSILYLGHIGRDKGSYDLIEAARLLREQTAADSFQLDIVGSEQAAGDVQQLNGLIESYRLASCVRIWPPAYDSDKIAWLAQADILVLPSYHEGMPISLIEAMAAGLAVIGSHVGGIPDLITHAENGLLVPPGEPGALADALASLIMNPETRCVFGARARERVCQHHDIRRYAVELAEIYRRVAMNGG